MVGHDDDTSGARDEGSIGGGLDEVRRGQTRDRIDAVHTEDERVDMERAQRGVGHRTDQRVRRSAHPAGQDDCQIFTLGGVKQVGHPRRVRHHGQVGDVRELLGHGVRRGAGRDGDR